MKEKLKKLGGARLALRQKDEMTELPRITNDNVAEHREEVLSGARKYIYPLQHSKHRIVLLSISLLITVLLVFSGSMVFLLYRRQSASNFVYQVTKVVPFPVARTGGTLISYENYLFELRHYIHYYETQQQLSFDTEFGRDQFNDYKRRALEDVVNLAYIKKFAAELGVGVAESEIDDQIRIAREQKRLGSSEDILEDVLKSYWNWSIDDFRRSLRNELLTQKVARALDPDTDVRAKEALARLRAGEDFGAVAKAVSDEQSTKEQGGDFGEVTSSNRNVSQQTVDTLLRTPVGQYSDIALVPYGPGYALEIVKNLEKTANGARGARIIFQIKDLGTTLNDRKEKEPYRLYISLPK